MDTHAFGGKHGSEWAFAAWPGLSALLGWLGWVRAGKGRDCQNCLIQQGDARWGERWERARYCSAWEEEHSGHESKVRFGTA